MTTDTKSATSAASAPTISASYTPVVSQSDRSILILYGTETGNSQSLAEVLCDTLRRIHLRPMLDEMNSVPMSSLIKYSAVIFVISTTGQGELPRNSRAFWKSLLRKRLSSTSLSRLCFAAFGLGDSTYPRFNWAVRKLYKRLCQLGASQIIEPGEADEQHPEGVDATFLPWAQDLRRHLVQKFPLPDSLQPIPDDALIPPLYPLELVPAEMWRQGRDEDANFPGRHALAAHFVRKNEATAKIFNPARVFDAQVDCDNMLKDFPDAYNLADTDRSCNLPEPKEMDMPDSWRTTVALNQRLSAPEHWQDIRCLALRIDGKQVGKNWREPQDRNFGPGSTIAIYPKNQLDDVAKLITLMGWEAIADRPVYFRSESSTAGELMGVPNGVYPTKPDHTLRDILVHNMDITAIPKRSFFDQIWHFTEDPTHKERLMEFADPKLTDEFFDYTTRPRRTILEVLEEFSSVKIPLEYVAAVFPPIRGRQFSVFKASIGKGGCLLVHLVIALVTYKTVLQRVRQGLCSRYVEHLNPNALIQVQVSGNPWPLYEDRQVLAVATGTGFAPLMFYFQERHIARTAGKILPLNDLLFLGSRDPAKDDIVPPELCGLGVDMRRAYSRREGKPREYVQDLILQCSKEVIKVLRGRAVVVICGSSGRMPEAVRSALIDVIIQEGEATTSEEANKFLARSQIIEETW